MSEQVPGIELFLSSEKAAAGAAKFREAVESAAQAVERIGAVVEKLEKTLDRLGVTAKESSDPLKKLGETAGKTDDKMRDGADGADKLGKGLGGLGRISGTVARQLATLLGTAGAISGLAAGVSAISDYEDKLRILGTIAGAAGQDLQRLETAAVQLSRSTRFSPREAVQGLTELSRAGLDADAAIQALKPTADLARVGLVGLGEASGIVSKTLTQFALGAEQSARVADVLAKAANISNADVSTLAGSLSKTGPVARQFGVSLEDTVAALARLADNGIAANIAGTGLQRVLIQLRSPTEQAQQALAGLGLTADQINPEKVGLIGALRNLAGANLQVQDAVGLVDTEFASLLTVLTGSVGAITQVGDVLRNSAGEAAKQAAAGANTLAASFADLRSASEEFAIAAGRGGIGGALTDITRAGAGALRVLTGDAEAMENASTSAKVLATGLQLVATGAGALLSFRLAAYFLSVSTATNAAKTAMAAFNVVAKANPLVQLAAAAGAVVSALVAFGSSSSEAEAKAAKQAREIDGLNDAYQKLFGTLSKISAAPGPFDDRGTTEATLRKARADLQQIGQDLQALKNERVPLEKVLGVAGLAGASDEVAKIQQLITDAPRIQQVAAQAARDTLDRLQAQKPIGLNFGAGEARLVESRRRQAEAAAAEAGVIRTLNEAFAALGVTVDANGQRFLSFEKAQQLVRQGLEAVDKQAAAAGVSLGKVGDATSVSSSVLGLIRERERELQIAQLVGVEREKAILLAEAERRAGGALNDAEKQRLATLANQLVDGQKLVEQRRREVQEAEKAAKLQEDLPKNLADLRAKYEEQLLLAQSEGTEREIIRAEIQATNDAKEIGLALDSEAFENLKRIAVEAAKLNAAQRNEKREARVDRRQSDAFRLLTQEEELLKRGGVEREKYRRQIEAENDARQAGLVLGSAEFQDYVRRKVAVEELDQALQTAGEAGAAFGQVVNSALERFIIDGERGRDVANAFGKDLLRLAYQMTVANNLQKLFVAAGQGLAGAFAGSATTPGASTSTGTSAIGAPAGGGYPNLTGGMVPRMTGGVIPAMGGQVIDEFAFMRRGGRNYSVSEGGATTPEAIFPLQRDQQGRLGVVGAGGGGDTINISLPGVRTQQEARAVRATIGQQLRQLRDADRRGRRGMRPRE